MQPVNEHTKARKKTRKKRKEEEEKKAEKQTNQKKRRKKRKETVFRQKYPNSVSITGKCAVNLFRPRQRTRDGIQQELSFLAIEYAIK